MADLVIVTPSRSRPARLREMVEAVHSTAAGDVSVVAGLDLDDPTLDEYRQNPVCRHVIGPRQSLSGWTNMLAVAALASNMEPPPRYLASLGDDHRPRTPGWDRKLIEAIESRGVPGIAYGDDLYHHASLCTAWVVSAQIVAALGWMMPPCCAHLYVDNAVMNLGMAAGRIIYRPDVVIEHEHPVAGTAPWDESYRESNSKQRYAADMAAFETWRRDQLAADVATVKETQCR